MNPNLQQAVAIFKELGWEKANLQNILQLPLGSTEQKKIALEGLKSGEWEEMVQTKQNAYGWQYGWKSFVDVDKTLLALFAVRIGITSRRASTVLTYQNIPMVVAVVAQRGAKYATDFIQYSCTSRRRAFEHSPSVFGSAAVQLVDTLGLEVPQNVEYIKDWAAYAAAALGLKNEVSPRETDLPTLEIIQKHFIQHIETGIAVNAPATGPFGEVLPAGVKAGWLPHDKAVELIFIALDAAVRPGDRKVWLTAIEQLKVSDNRLQSNIQGFIPLLALGDTNVITQLAPPLIAGAEGDLLIEVLQAAFSATTKKAKKIVLKAALTRPCPQNAEELAPWLAVLAVESDMSIAALATKLAQQWGISASISQQEETQIQGLWQPTPPVWQMPPFELGEVSPDALTNLAAKLVSQHILINDITTEHFLAIANALAFKDPSAARTSLQGLRSEEGSLYHFINSWVNEETPQFGSDKDYNDYNGKLTSQQHLMARNYIVCLHLGKLPCLLSTPSNVDLSINLPQLVARLTQYQQIGAPVLEADLQLALTRLNLNTQTPQAIKTLSGLELPILLQSNKPMQITAGQAVLGYLKEPFEKPPLTLNRYRGWGDLKIKATGVMAEFPNRFPYYQIELFSVFPLWGDTALSAVQWSSEVYHEQGLVLRQVARRATPLPGGGAINLLACQRSMSTHAAEDSMLAVTEAWERGLLRPGIADIKLLDWSTDPPSNLVAFALALESIAQEGMLSVVWPILDALICTSLEAPRLLAGTSEIVQLVLTFLPEVIYAQQNGTTDETALYLPGIRSLALRSGSSRGVITAKKILALLPKIQLPSSQKTLASPPMHIPFAELWPAPKNVTAPIEDGATLKVQFTGSNTSTKLFLFTLTLPNITDRVFQIVNDGWVYALENEGQCNAYAAAPNTNGYTKSNDKQVWLHWDEQTKTIVVCQNRNWRENIDAPLQGNITPLPLSLLTIVVGLLAQDGNAKYFAPHRLKKFIKSGQITPQTVYKATQTLLQNKVVSPAKLVRSLEKDNTLLPVLWPMLTLSTKAAGKIVEAGNPPPVWVNRILDLAWLYSPYLVEAAKQGFIPPEDAKWDGLAAISTAKSKSTAVSKAKKLKSALGL